MTSLGVALAIDSRGPSGMYIITDSRLTSPAGGIFDAGQKAFTSGLTPDIFGFCGDAFLPPAIIRQVTCQIASGILFGGNTSAEERHRIFFRQITEIWRIQKQMPVGNFSLFHGSRDGEFMESKFRLWITNAVVNRNTGITTWSDNEIVLDKGQSYFAHLDGSGAAYVAVRVKEFYGTIAAGTSRAAIWSFCNTLHEGKDRFSGGPPQLVGLWRKGISRDFGFFWKGKPYLCGAEAPASDRLANVNWFNHRFERCHWQTGKRLSKAARHAK